ncbi:PPM-type phosphatase domain-containing protein [Favolaschia claudopus]|uniref:PPM-type phosphatase domain-containing protein n=1 Tax=Favolaschia claudopus TaxID=2862362 RepID=A0AAW0D6X9_9AGAR
MRVYQSKLPTKDEDRTIILPFEHGTMIAIFDGHHSNELAEFASQHLPQMVANCFDLTDQNLDESIVEIFRTFDQSLVEPIYALFPPDEDWTGPEWEDPGNVHEVIGYGQDDPQFKQGRLAIVGTTVLIGIIDKKKESLWVVSLGDSYAVCGRMENERMVPIVISDNHNGHNDKEIKRIHDEHPGEENIVRYDRVLGYLAVTRALGNHQLKVQSQPLARRIMPYFYPSPVCTDTFEACDHNGHHTPPYMSSTPTIHRYDLLPGDVLVFASDGLADSMYYHVAREDRWDVIMSLVSGEDDERLGWKAIRPEGPTNIAELLIKNTLFGVNAEKMAEELADPGRDDVSVVVVDLATSHSSTRLLSS